MEAFKILKALADKGNKLAQTICESILEDRRLRDTSYLNPKFEEGEIVAWVHANGNKSIACLTDKQWAFAILNMRGRDDETERIWYCDNIPADVCLGQYPIVSPTKEELKKFLLLLCKDYEHRIDEENKQQNDNSNES